MAFLQRELQYYDSVRSDNIVVAISMSLDLKHIPCPAGDGCTAFKCIFGHKKDKATAPELSQSPPGPDRSHPTDNQNKKPKVDTIAVEQPVTGRVPARDRPATATRTISPPPTKRPSLGHQTSRPSNGKQTPPSNTTQNASKPKIIDKPAKVESLNPRLLKHSPASHELRLKLLKLLHAELKRLNDELKKDIDGKQTNLVLSEQAIITRALNEEEIVATEKASVYANVMKNKVMTFKRKKAAEWKEDRAKEVSQTSKKRSYNDIDGPPIEIKTGLSPAQEVELLHHLYTPISDLASHGYVPSVPSDETVQAAKEGVEAAKGWEVCDRCQQRFQVFPGRRESDGALTSGGPCKFHWGRLYFPGRNPGETNRLPKRYKCCNQEIGESSGCITHPDHVFKASDPKRLAVIMNFVQTPDNMAVTKDRVVCFDCEMGYTTYGMELIRLTATLWPSGDLLIDILVKPFGEVLDLNSRFSGVTPDDLMNGSVWQPGDDLIPTQEDDSGTTADGEVSKDAQLKVVGSPKIARDLLFSQISPSTPLIGHGLENDLNAMRIVHPTIIDTILLFPHKAGLPYRHGLRMLMDKHLNKKIQQETGPKMLGHDSAEDARAAGELVHFKLLEKWNEMKRSGWKFVEGHLVPADDQGKLTEEFLESKH